MTRLEAQVTHRFGAFTLDAGLTLDFPEDAPVAALFGPSGSGKSTLLAVVAGSLRPERGRVVLGDATLLDTDAAVVLPPEARGVGVVPQEGLLFPHLDVEGNLRYGTRRARGRSGPDHDRVVDVLGLGGLLRRAPAGLSGGERQRVALGRALLAAPRLLLLDEPVSALDERSRWQVLAFIETVVREFRVPTLFVSHVRAEVLRIAPLAARMAAGRVEQVGPAEEVLGDDSLPGPVWNLLHAAAEGEPGAETDHARLGNGLLHLPTHVPAGRDVWCRISSNAVTLLRDGEPADHEHATEGLSARNRFLGRIIHLHEGAGRIRAAVGLSGAPGVALQVDLTPDAVADLGLTPGVAVLCLFKAHAIEPLP